MLPPRYPVAFPVLPSSGPRVALLAVRFAWYAARHPSVVWGFGSEGVNWALAALHALAEGETNQTRRQALVDQGVRVMNLWLRIARGIGLKGKPR